MNFKVFKVTRERIVAPQAVILSFFGKSDWATHLEKQTTAAQKGLIQATTFYIGSAEGSIHVVISMADFANMATFSLLP
jgi:hypothetical protein